jgi:hypothetical protein
VLYLIASPVFRDVWRVYSNTSHNKGMTADRGGWVIGAAGKGLMPYFLPKLRSRPRCLDVPCNIYEAQACTISMSIKSWISPDVQVSSLPRTALTVHDSQIKVKWVMAGGYWRPSVALSSLVLKGFRGTRVTAGRVTCSNVARNGDSMQEGVCPQRRQQQQMPPVTLASGTGESSQHAPRYSTVTIMPTFVIPIIGRVQSHKIMPSCNVRWKQTCYINISNSRWSKSKPAVQLSLI